MAMTIRKPQADVDLGQVVVFVGRALAGQLSWKTVTISHLLLHAVCCWAAHLTFNRSARGEPAMTDSLAAARLIPVIAMLGVEPAAASGYDAMVR